MDKVEVDNKNIVKDYLDTYDMFNIPEADG